METPEIHLQRLVKRLARTRVEKNRVETIEHIWWVCMNHQLSLPEGVPEPEPFGGDAYGEDI